MLYAEKGNKVKSIDESQVDACVAQGYTIVNEFGAVIKETIPTGLAELRLAYTKNAEEIEQLKATNARLEAELAATQAELAATQAEVAKKSAKTPTAPVSEDITEEAPKPSKRSRKAATE